MSADITTALAPVHFLELEITGRCQLSCRHCYASSGPAGGHGTMTTGDWEDLLVATPGAGIKTVLPSEAHAKIVCRLVPGQDPAKVADAIAEHVARNTPPGAQATVQRLGFTADAYLMPADHWGNKAVSAVLTEMYGREPYYVRTGGSIPVCTLFQRHLGAYTTNFAFGLDDERAHSPDEFFRLSSFRRGQEGYCKLLHRLGEQQS